MKDKILPGKLVYRKADGKLVGCIYFVHPNGDIVIPFLTDDGVPGIKVAMSSSDFKIGFTTIPPKGEGIYVSGVGPNGEPLRIGTVPDHEPKTLWDAEYGTQEPDPKIIKRGRLDILQDLTEQGAIWRLETDAEPTPLAMPLICWMQASARDRSKEFDDIRNAIDWIIEQVCEKGS